MREFKFRGWHTIAKKMFYPQEMGEDQLTLMPDGKGFVNVSSINTKLSQFITEMIPMECTGLKDKNNKEIYEGDILQITTSRERGFQDDGRKINLAPVEFGRFCVSNNSLYVFNGFHIDGDSIEYKLSHGGEVIGNIYENPELFQNEQQPTNT